MSLTVHPPPRRAASGRGAAAYLVMLATTVGLFLLIRQVGEGVAAPEPPANAMGAAVAPGAGHVDVVAHVLTTLATVIALGYILGQAFRLIGQPPVIGEVVAGILLGPSLLGAISPEAMHALIPSSDTDPHGQVRAALQAVAQLGVVLYMFLIGLELNAAQLRDHAPATITMSHSGIGVSFVFGAGLALWLYPLYSSRDVPFTSFALFTGVALAVTAFPVLARILADRNLGKTELGVRALGCAASDDVTAWCLLALAVGVAKSQAATAAAVGIGAVLFIVGMLLIVRPLAARVCRRMDEPILSPHRADPGRERPLPSYAVPGVFAAVLLSALATELIGIHAVFGGFLLGVVIPHDSRLAKEFTRRLEDVVTVLLLPAFFALSGMRTDLGLIAGWQDGIVCGVLILAATAGKFGGVAVAARLNGQNWRTAAALGAMMNTRGLMGLIVLDIGLTMGVISPTLFSMMVVMALFTTLLTGPALNLLLRDGGTHTAAD